MDWRGEVYAVSRAVGLTAKEVRARLGECNPLPNVDEIRRDLSSKFSEKLRRFVGQLDAQHQKNLSTLNERKAALVQRQRADRQHLKSAQENRARSEIQGRSHRLPSELKKLWWKVTGRWDQMSRLIEQETSVSQLRDRQERQKLIEQQLAERRMLQREIRQERDQQELARNLLGREMAHYATLSQDDQDIALSNREAARNVRGMRRRSRDVD